MTNENIAQLTNEVKILESQNKVNRHEQIKDAKPCFSAFIDLQVLPEPGERNKTFHALSAEYRRMGYSEEMTYSRMQEYYLKLPDDVVFSPGEDGQGFSLKEVESIVHGVFRTKENHSCGCNNPLWSRVCIDSCTFKKKLSGKSEQSFESAYFKFLQYWLNSSLHDSDLKAYLGLMVIEYKRQFKPGSLLFISQRELSEASGVCEKRIADSLERLRDHKLITYEVGKRRRIASEIRRLLPIPKPSVS